MNIQDIMTPQDLHNLLTREKEQHDLKGQASLEEFANSVDLPDGYCDVIYSHTFPNFSSGTGMYRMLLYIAYHLKKVTEGVKN